MAKSFAEAALSSLDRAATAAGIDRKDGIEPRALGVLVNSGKESSCRMKDRGRRDDFIAHQQERVSDIFRRVAPKLCESPIEQVMLAALCYLPVQNYTTWPPAVYDLTRKDPLPHADVIIIPQFPFGPYRYDYLIFGRKSDFDNCALAVECDGHEFHHETRHQHDRDSFRDKLSRGLGVKTVRFPGTLIWHDARGCADEVASHLDYWHANGRWD